MNVDRGRLADYTLRGRNYLGHSHGARGADLGSGQRVPSAGAGQSIGRDRYYGCVARLKGDGLGAGGMVRRNGRDETLDSCPPPKTQSERATGTR